MAKQTSLPSPFLMQLGEYIVPTIIAFTVIMSIIVTYYAINKVTNPPPTAEIPTLTPTPPIVDADPFKTTTLRKGTGTAAVKAGDKVTVNYVGTLKKDGKQFDSSYAEGRTPFDFTVGQGMVIPGWDRGLIGMKVGEKRRLQIPASLGYGSVGQGSIPGNATLMFDVELLKIE